MHTTPEQKPQFVGMEKMEQPFVEHVLQAYRRHKKLDAISLEYSEFLRYLIAHQVISTRALRRFTLGYDFQDLRRRGLGKNKTQVVRLLASRYGLHESTVWNELAQPSPFLTSKEFNS